VDALRDRLVNFFEIRQMTHKPKLVGVTGCLPGAGVTTLATGLAAALSETGDGNVLLVDMNGRDAAAHAFYQGTPARGLNELLEDQDRSTALVQDNLYFASALGEEGRLRRVLPRQFGNLVPKLIFDLPPLNQTSATGRIARFMDMMFLVIEAEETDRELAQKACQLLDEAKTHAAVVMNKYRSYVPRWLHREFQ
jgi:Mrp family chromosome partitioning ATPase